MALIQRNRLSVIHNDYQGKHFKVLTVCSAGCLRSPTAAHILSSEPWNFNTRCAGTSKEYAIIPVTYELIEWADEIVVMDDDQLTHINAMQNIMLKDNQDTGGGSGWKYKDYVYKKVHNLEIEDNYGYRDPKLVELMTKKFMEIY